MHSEIKKYLEESLQNKKGLTFYFNGNTVSGYVVRIIDDLSVGVRNQSSSEVVILLNRLDAIGMS